MPSGTWGVAMSSSVGSLNSVGSWYSAGCCVALAEGLLFAASNVGATSAFRTEAGGAKRPSAVVPRS